jgi:hypothetical protein
MSSYTLDDIRAAADAKYSSTDITVGSTVVKMLNPLRLTKEARAELLAIQSELDSDSDDAPDQTEGLTKAIRVVCETPAQADALLGAIGDDLATLAQVFETYGKNAQVGEASASAN